ncbi:uncharacterized protein LOC131957158 isoform X2 [Physella acuta]|uniref:uncharacterized protein LOC131957158 isoform X2 n=1 Tax=Physella acuta TaxID=109671 RepID=UPI0027DD6E2C|nr:uncharacterized protein LOC131957158 isoform X2 [Physella acuta]
MEPSDDMALFRQLVASGRFGDTSSEPPVVSSSNRARRTGLALTRAHTLDNKMMSILEHQVLSTSGPQVQESQAPENLGRRHSVDSNIGRGRTPTFVRTYREVQWKRVNEPMKLSRRFSLGACTLCDPDEREPKREEVPEELHEYVNGKHIIRKRVPIFMTKSANVKGRRYSAGDLVPVTGQLWNTKGKCLIIQDNMPRVDSGESKSTSSEFSFTDSSHDMTNVTGEGFSEEEDEKEFYDSDEDDVSDGSYRGGRSAPRKETCDNGSLVGPSHVTPGQGETGCGVDSVSVCRGSSTNGRDNPSVEPRNTLDKDKGDSDSTVHLELWPMPRSGRDTQPVYLVPSANMIDDVTVQTGDGTLMRLHRMGYRCGSSEVTSATWTSPARSNHSGCLPDNPCNDKGCVIGLAVKPRNEYQRQPSRQLNDPFGKNRSSSSVLGSFVGCEACARLEISLDSTKPNLDKSHQLSNKSPTDAVLQSCGVTHKKSDRLGQQLCSLHLSPHSSTSSPSRTDMRQQVKIPRGTISQPGGAGVKGHGTSVPGQGDGRHVVWRCLLESVLSESQTSASNCGGSTVAIDNKIEQAMDLVKRHLMYAVREEVEILKQQIGEMMERIGQLEYENTVLRAEAKPETLNKLLLPRVTQAPPTVGLPAPATAGTQAPQIPLQASTQPAVAPQAHVQPAVQQPVHPAPASQVSHPPTSHPAPQAAQHPPAT